MARVSRCFSGWSAASSGLMTPRRTCSAGHEWSCEMSLALPLRKRYAGLSPTFTSPRSPPRIAATTSVLPMPAHSGFLRAASNTAVLACLQARLSRLRSGPSSPSSASTAANVLHAIELAVWPAAWPPMPSHTISSESSPALLRQTTTESSFSSRSRPGSVAQAILSRISGSAPLSLDDHEADGVLADRDPVPVVQLLLLDRLTVDQRAVGAAEVDDPELLAAALDASMVAAGGRVAKDHVVVGRAADAQRRIACAVVVPGVRAGLDRQLCLRAPALHCAQDRLGLGPGGGGRCGWRLPCRDHRRRLVRRGDQCPLGGRDGWGRRRWRRRSRRDRRLGLGRRSRRSPRRLDGGR